MSPTISPCLTAHQNVVTKEKCRSLYILLYDKLSEKAQSGKNIELVVVSPEAQTNVQDKQTLSLYLFKTE